MRIISIYFTSILLTLSFCFGSESTLAASSIQINHSEKSFPESSFYPELNPSSLLKRSTTPTEIDSLVQMKNKSTKNDSILKKDTKNKPAEEITQIELSPKELERQEKRQIKRLEEMTFIQRIKAYKGMQVSFDLVGPANYYYGYSWLRTEAQLKVNLNNQFFPVFTLGYAKCDDVTDGTKYKTSAPYMRIGMDYNMRWKNQNDNHLLLGLRYGFSSFKYDVNSPDIKDEIWGGTNEVNYQNESSSAHWLEAVIGIQTKIWGPILAGWDFRYMVSIGVKENEHTKPYYIPGYGENNGPSFMFTYRIIYKLPL